jgi:hypothetical protein
LAKYVEEQLPELAINTDHTNGKTRRCHACETTGGEKNKEEEFRFSLLDKNENRVWQTHGRYINNQV